MMRGLQRDVLLAAALVLVALLVGLLAPTAATLPAWQSVVRWLLVLLAALLGVAAVILLRVRRLLTGFTLSITPNASVVLPIPSIPREQLTERAGMIVEGVGGMMRGLSGVLFAWLVRGRAERLIGSLETYCVSQGHEVVDGKVMSSWLAQSGSSWLTGLIRWRIAFVLCTTGLAYMAALVGVVLLGGTAESPESPDSKVTTISTDGRPAVGHDR